MGRGQPVRLAKVETIACGPDDARSLFAETGFDQAYWRSVRGAKGICRLTSQVDVPETIQVPTDRPMLVAANHSSLFDLIAALVFLGHYGINSRLAVNSRFFSNPAGGKFLRSIGCIPFSRDDRAAAEKTTIDALLSGQVAAIMPEGRITRKADQVNGVGPARPGISRIARGAGAAILPVGFAYSDEAWRPGTPLPKPRLGRHHVIANVGEPIVLETDDHESNAAAVMTALGDLVISARSRSSA